ncbi:LOW QUALITY PROTEIN: butyrophilin-like protein 10 [Rhynchonycteris naso]
MIKDQAIILRKANLTICGPAESVLAMVGEDTELPCHLSLNISTEDMALWYRERPSQAIHKGEDMQEEQLEHYQGRTTFVRAGLARDHTAVRIHNVALLNGTFHCHFKDGTMSEKATLWLRVAGTRMECTSAGWYSKSQVEWTDFRGQSLPSVTNLSASTNGL